MDRFSFLIILFSVVAIFIAVMIFSAVSKNPGNPLGNIFPIGGNKQPASAENSNEVGKENMNNNTNNFEISGMKVEVLKEGSGEAAKTGDTVFVHYVGTLENGSKFDSSIDRGTPFDFTLGSNRVIQGWEFGILGMKAGEKRKLTIPPELGYGESGFPGVIPPNAILIFEVELLEIRR